VDWRLDATTISRTISGKICWRAYTAGADTDRIFAPAAVGWLYDYVCLLWSELYLNCTAYERPGVDTPGPRGDPQAVSQPGLAARGRGSMQAQVVGPTNSGTLAAWRRPREGIFNGDSMGG